MHLGIILLWVILTAICIIDPGWIKGRSFRPFEIAGWGVVAGVINALIIYFLMPSLLLTYLIPMLLIYTLVVFGIKTQGAMFEKDNNFPQRGKEKEYTVTKETVTLLDTITKIVGVLLIVYIIVYGLAGILCATNLAQIPSVITTIEGATANISIDHIRQVSTETAQWRADKPIGSLGTRSEVSNVHIQLVNNTLTWIAPLDYSDWIKALSYKDEGTGGYVLVSAEDPVKDPVLVTCPIRYTPNAVFGHDLYRTIYMLYPWYGIKESVFQLDDQGNPVFVTMLTENSIGGIIGEVPHGMVVTNAETGKNTFYAMDNLPCWIHRAADEGLVKDYLYWWGYYSNGWFTQFLSGEGLKKPSGGVVAETTGNGVVNVEGGTNIYIVVGTDNQLYFFCPLSTPGKDTSTVGYMLINARTMKFMYYHNEGLYDYLGAAKNAQQDPEVSKSVGLRVTQPIMYIYKGQEIWVIPIISQEGEMKMIAIVNAHDGQVFIGDTLQEAMSKFTGELIPQAPSDETEKQLISDIKSLLAQADVKIEQLEQLRAAENNSSATA